MGLQINCPLCCNETFSSHKSLKYHLLSVVDNLLCSVCQRRFDNVFELAMHLDEQCNDGIASTQDEISTSAVEMDFQNIQSGTGFNSCNKSTLEQDKGSIVSMESFSEVHQDLMPESPPTDQYYCSTCDINFLSIEEHLHNFHSGEEIVLASDEEEENVGEVLMHSDSQSEVPDTLNVNQSVDIKTARLLNTIQEEDCVDKDGRLYLRKVVKIEKFWNDVQIHSSSTDVSRLPFAVNDNGLLEKLVPTNETENSIEVYVCSNCEMKFLSVLQYNKHKCCGRYKICKVCNAHFINSSFLNEHMLLHHKKKIIKPSKNLVSSFVCEICNTTFTTSKSLRLHRRMHEPIKTKDVEPPAIYDKEGENLNGANGIREMFVCQICHKIYHKEYEDVHIQSHSRDASLNCEVCNRKFCTQKNLNMHMNAHLDVKKYLCPNCKKPFLSEERLEAHNPSQCQKRQYECQYCGRRFSRPHEKVKHERIHTGEKPHVCSICGKTFRVSYCLTLHMRTHSGTRPYHCKVCGKRFKAHSVFSHHMLTHSNDRKYKCPFCPKTFKTSVQLAGHKNSHIKPFNCTECNRPFASLYSVRAHMETHQRQNNLKFKCWICGASYARAFALRDHFKEQHSGEMETFVLEVEEKV